MLKGRVNLVFLQVALFIIVAMVWESNRLTDSFFAQKGLKLIHHFMAGSLLALFSGLLTTIGFKLVTEGRLVATQLLQHSNVTAGIAFAFRIHLFLHLVSAILHYRRQVINK